MKEPQVQAVRGQGGLIRAGRRLELLRDSMRPRSMTRRVRAHERAIEALSRAGSISSVEASRGVDGVFTANDQVLIAGGGGGVGGKLRGRALSVPLDRVLGRPLLGGPLAPYTLPELGAARSSLKDHAQERKLGSFTTSEDVYAYNLIREVAVNMSVTLENNPQVSKIYVFYDGEGTWNTGAATFRLVAGAGDTINGAATYTLPTNTHSQVIAAWSVVARNWSVVKMAP